MEIEDVKNVSVIGAGTMGYGIVIDYALGGYNVVMNDISEDILNGAIRRIRNALGIFVESNMISADAVADTLSRIQTTTSMETAARNADIVVETVTEIMDLKKRLFSTLDQLCPRRTILTSNTSSLLISEMASNVSRRDKVVITHYFNPAHIVPVVEIAKGAETSDETVSLMRNVLKKLKKIPIIIKTEIPGLIVNRIQMAIRREVWSLLEKEIASAEDIDSAVKGTIGFRLASIGPLLTIDLAGMDASYKVSKNLFPLISDSHEVPLFIKNKIEANEIGYKTGKGIFDYSMGEWEKRIKQRDKEFLKRLKCLYWAKE